MTQCDLFLQPEAAFQTLSDLGEMECIQFLDQPKEDSQTFQRNYMAEVRRFDAMERQLRYLEMEATNANIKIPKAKDEPNALNPKETLDLENLLDEWEEDVDEMSTNEASLLQNYVDLVELEYVLGTIGPLLGDGEEESKLGKQITTAAPYLLQGGHLFIFTGVVRRSRSFPFEMMLWRISRGNIYYRQANEDKVVFYPTLGQEVRRVAFLVICQGEELSTRAEKVCNGFRAKLYPIPKNSAEREELLYKVGIAINDLEQVVKKTKYHRCKALRVVAKDWSRFSIKVKKAAAIYHNLNRFNFDVTKNCLIGRCWVAEKDLNKIQTCLDKNTKQAGTNIPSFMTKRETTDMPPTYFRLNKFTAGFQNLINAYGAATYKELNPGIYTIITFPFLFALMFGDLGHGILLVAFSSWMIHGEKDFIKQKSTNEIWNIMFGGRYVILLLGLFSMYTGFLYNDLFGRVMNFPGSWLSFVMTSKMSDDEVAGKETLELNPKNSRPYIWGNDPVWAVIFLNM
ncbi:unnamed protein product [Diatraea saccharalis]|uniref:V-type proton ATPase subunit a n=1 Tax=Diatraea saccharalis TaxID=40085 RepID=A0A9N9MZ03_9NEOP|nr:unnamed protein product [Diatraea saccharalis]